MKQSLGKILMIGCSMFTLSWGGPFHWNLLDAPQSLQVGETGMVRYECTFETSAADYTIDFKPASTEAYKAEILTQRDRVSGGKRIQTFDVLITPKQTGAVNVRLEALVRHTTFASIENATIGRDNVKKYDFNDEKVILPPVQISAQENDADLTGEIVLEAKTDTKSVRAFEPVHLSMYIRGKGNLDQFTPYELNISGVKVFAEAPSKSLHSVPEGHEGEIRQEFALVAEKSFVIPSLTLEIFDTKERRYKTLSTQSIHIEVDEGYEPSALIDPPDLSDTATLKRYALYAALIVLGALMGEAVRKLWNFRPRRRAQRFWDTAKTSKELVTLLALTGEKKYEPIIRTIEEEGMSLGEAKKKLSTLISEKEEKR